MTVLEVDTCGTRTSYRRGCRCGDCREAERVYRAHRRRAPRGYVPAGMVRAHLQALHADGLSYREIARRAGVDVRTAHRIAVGTLTRCTAGNRARILAVMGRSTGDISVVTPVEHDEQSKDDPLASLRLIVDPESLDWKTEAECRRDDLSAEDRHRWFFPLRGDSTEPALRICDRCPVWRECLTFALRGNEEGIWGRTAGSHRREIVHHAIKVDELGEAVDAYPDLAMVDVIRRVLAQREPVAS